MIKPNPNQMYKTELLFKGGGGGWGGRAGEGGVYAGAAEDMEQPG